MNSKNIMIGLAATVLAGVLIYASSGGGGVLPPEPDPVIDGIAQVAANDVGTFAAAVGENTAECAKKIRSGEIKTTDAALKWWKDANDESRFKAFQPLHDELQTAVSTGDVNKLADAMDAAAPGFRASIKGQ